MRSIKCSALWMAAGVVLAPGAAHAAMTYAPDTGTVAQARGGAFTAAASDPMAIVYNPAGFADQRKTQVLIDIKTLKLMNSFDREDCGPSEDPSTGVPQETPCGKVTNKGALKISPNVVFSMPIGETLAWHVGLHSAVGVNHQYPNDGPQRFSNRSQTPQQVSYTAGVAWRAAQFVSIGFTAGGMYVTNEQEVTSSANTTTPPEENEHPGLDSPVELKVKDPFTPTAILGAKFYLPGSVEIGASFRPRVDVSMGGTYASQTTPIKEDAHLNVTLPWVLRSGVRKVGTGWDAELDFTVEGWGGRKYDTIVVDDGDLNGYSKLPVLRNGRTAYRIGLGGSYAMSEALALHGGYLFETSGIPKELMVPHITDTPKHGLNAGVSYTFSRFTVSGNLNYTHLTTTKVSNGQARQRASFAAFDDPARLAVVNNGTYSGYYAMAGVSFLAKF